MRRLFCTLLAIPAFLVATESGSQLEKLAMESKPISEHFTGQLKGTKVRMRLQPDLDSKVVRELGRGELVMITGEANDYYAIQPPEGMKLFVYRTFVLDNVIEGNHVNVRLAPDLEAPVIAQLNAGTRVKTTPSENPKWLAIDPPQTVQFFVAKDFVENIGGPELVTQRDKRLLEGGHLLNSAYMLSQAELRRPFEEIDLEKVRKSFERVIHEYRDVSEYGERAQAVLDLVSEIYAQKETVYLEEKSGTHVASAPRQQMERGLEELDQHVALASGEEPAPLEADVSRVELAAHYQGDWKTDKMRLWEPIEEAIYHLWAVEKEFVNMDAFYDEQSLDAQLLTGIVEPYQRPVQNRPGDFVLRVNQRPVAYLYSTQINLEQCVGQEVTLQCLSRSNNNFAFPAYYVMAVGD